jgi:hypothetical protein
MDRKSIFLIINACTKNNFFVGWVKPEKNRWGSYLNPSYAKLNAYEEV